VTTRPVKSHKFSSGVYKITFVEHLHGYTDRPEGNHDTYREIVIAEDDEPQEVLQTIIHESLHAEFPKMGEAPVTAAGSNIARLLWRLGYRRCVR
jgi:hypothetical protein